MLFLKKKKDLNAILPLSFLFCGILYPCHSNCHCRVNIVQGVNN